MTLTDTIRDVCKVGRASPRVRYRHLGDAYYERIASMDEQTVRRLMVVSYVGRGDGDFSKDFERQIQSAMPEFRIVVSMLYEKPVEYMERGLVIAAREGFDLDMWEACP